MMPDIDLILFDVGGVLGTDGWDRHQRASAVENFALEKDQFESRHQDAISWWEEGRMTMAEYLDATVFYQPRPFTREAFSAFMFAQSKPCPEMIALARALAKAGTRHLMTLNNEPAELNQHRIEIFALRDIFSAFFSSCYLGVRKPTPLIYRRALSIAQADPSRTVFIDDREQNLTPAQSLGIHTIQATTAADVQRQLATLNVTFPL